jgi:uncharacterized protein
VIDPVWQLLAQAYALCGPLPTLLERDFNFPPFGELLDEVAKVRQLQQREAQIRELQALAAPNLTSSVQA